MIASIDDIVLSYFWEAAVQLPGYKACSSVYLNQMTTFWWADPHSSLNLQDWNKCS